MKKSKSSNTLQLTLPKARNPLALMARQRQAGSHQMTTKQQRQANKASLRKISLSGD